MTFFKPVKKFEQQNTCISLDRQETHFIVVIVIYVIRIHVHVEIKRRETKFEIIKTIIIIKEIDENSARSFQDEFFLYLGNQSAKALV